MSLAFSSPIVAPSLTIYLTDLHTKSSRNSSLSIAFSSIIHYKLPSGSDCERLRHKPLNALEFSARSLMGSSHQRFTDVSLNWEVNEQEEDEDMGSPWEGAIIYKRNPSISHVEYCTTLERLGLAKLSTDVSKSRASVMGLRVTKAVKDYPLGTPVQISLDVTRKKKKLRLDGIIKTVITLNCNSCGELAAESVYSNFSLLLTEKPSQEAEVVDMGVIYGEDKSKFCATSFEDDDDDDNGEASIDWDDQFHFPPEDKEIDISKPIRDAVHLEVTMNAVCNPNCRGICLVCGTNLNKSSCNCSEKKVKGNDSGPFKNLRKQMQTKPV